MTPSVSPAATPEAVGLSRAAAKRGLAGLPRLFEHAASHSAGTMGQAVIRLDCILAAVHQEDVDGPMLAQIQESLDHFVASIADKAAGSEPWVVEVPREKVLTKQSVVNAFDSEKFARSIERLVNDTPSRFGLAFPHRVTAQVVTTQEDLRHGVGADDTQQVVITVKA